jgi:hypothetical protein
MSFGGGAGASGLVLAGIGASVVPILVPAGSGSGGGTTGAVGGSGTTAGGLFNWGGMAAG